MSERKIDFDLYLITDRKLFADNNRFLAAIEEALKGGLKAVQIREKDLPTRELLKMAYEMRELTSKYDAMLFVNDRLDIALAVNADGVHLGQTGIPAYGARKVVGDKLMIGVSSHNPEEAITAEKEGADFITFGPVFATPSKMKYGSPVGIDMMKKVRGIVSLPVFAIGGIKPANVKDVMDAGASGVAVISGILAGDDVKASAEKYLKLTGEKK